MNKKKTILLICKEEFAYPMYFIGKELENKNNNVHYYFVQNTESTKKDAFNKTTYFYFKDKIKSENIHDVKDISLEFINNRENIKLDYSRLEEIEKKYTYFKGLNKQILSSQGTSTPYHDRFYYRPTTYKENLYWLMLNYNKAEEILNSIKPDYIFDLEVSELQRTVINEVANYKKIMYVTPEDARYKNFKIPTFNLGLEPENYFIEAYNKNKIDKNLQKYSKEVHDYVSQSSIMPKRYEDNKEWRNNFANNYGIIDALRHIVHKTFKQIKFQLYYLRNNKKLLKYNVPLNSHPFKRLLWYYNYAIRKFYLFSKFNKYFLEPCDEKYIFLPLHVIPENSTYVKGPMYLNQLNLIEAISKSLPISWKLYVKEHPNMIALRDVNFYKSLKKLGCVIMHPSFDHKLLIQNSLAVATLNSSVGIEALCQNRPVLCLSKPYYASSGHIILDKSMKISLETINEYLSKDLSKSLKESVKIILESSVNFSIPDIWYHHNNKHYNYSNEIALLIDKFMKNNKIESNVFKTYTINK